VGTAEEAKVRRFRGPTEGKGKDVIDFEETPGVQRLPVGET
jgi:hypothetical protein